jgi:hypothetical protein
MTTRQQSLINARRACEWLSANITDGLTRAYLGGIEVQQQVKALIEGFNLLTQSSRRPHAGRPPLPNPSPKTLAQRRYRANLKAKPKPKQ